MNIKDDLEQKRKTLDNVLRISEKLLKEIKEEKKVKNINELVFCLMLLQQLAVEQKKKLERKPPVGITYT